jgi:hypothetical protein
MTMEIICNCIKIRPLKLSATQNTIIKNAFLNNRKLIKQQINCLELILAIINNLNVFAHSVLVEDIIVNCMS